VLIVAEQATGTIDHCDEAALGQSGEDENELAAGAAIRVRLGSQRLRSV